MKRIVDALVLGMILGLPLVADNNGAINSYCSESQINSTILNDSKQITNDSLNGVNVYASSSVTNDRKTKKPQVWVQSYITAERHEDMVKRGVGELGYMKLLREFDYKNNKNRMLSQAYYRCDGSILGTISTPDDWADTIPGSLNEQTLKLTLDNSSKKSK